MGGTEKCKLKQREISSLNHYRNSFYFFLNYKIQGCRPQCDPWPYLCEWLDSGGVHRGRGLKLDIFYVPKPGSDSDGPSRTGPVTGQTQQLKYIKILLCNVSWFLDSNLWPLLFNMQQSMAQLQAFLPLQSFFIFFYFSFIYIYFITLYSVCVHACEWAFLADTFGNSSEIFNFILGSDEGQAEHTYLQKILWVIPLSSDFDIFRSVDFGGWFSVT